MKPTKRSRVRCARSDCHQMRASRRWRDVPARWSPAIGNSHRVSHLASPQRFDGPTGHIALTRIPSRRGNSHQWQALRSFKPGRHLACKENAPTWPLGPPFAKISRRVGRRWTNSTRFLCKQGLSSPTRRDFFANRGLSHQLGAFSSQAKARRPTRRSYFFLNR